MDERRAGRSCPGRNCRRCGRRECLHRQSRGRGVFAEHRWCTLPVTEGWLGLARTRPESAGTGPSTNEELWSSFRGAGVSRAHAASVLSVADDPLLGRSTLPHLGVNALNSNADVASHVAQPRVQCLAWLAGKLPEPLDRPRVPQSDVLVLQSHERLPV